MDQKPLYIPNLTEVVDDLPDVDSSMVPWMPEPKPSAIPFTLWEVLAYDLALDTAPETDLLQAYNINQEQLNDLKENDHFKRILAEKKSEIEQLGSDANHAIQFRIIAQQGAKHFLDRMLDPNTSNKDFLNMYKTATTYAQLDPEQNKDDGAPVGVGGSSQMTFNIYGVPGLEHLNGGTPPADPSIKTVDAEEVTVIPDNDDDIDLEEL